MMIAAFEPDHENAALVEGHLLPRQTTLRSRLGEGEQTSAMYGRLGDISLVVLVVSVFIFGSAHVSGLPRASVCRRPVERRFQDGPPPVRGP
ncbi:MAG: hypothetical protein AAGJ52_14250 [Pseudomonadota bacterium]